MFTLKNKPLLIFIGILKKSRTYSLLNYLACFRKKLINAFFRRAVLFVGLCGFLCTNTAFGLGIGEITVKSKFNEPLDASIQLFKVGDLTPDELLVSLGSRDHFKQAGIDRNFFLSGLRFEVILDNASTPFIRVTSTKPVTEPYLNFLIYVQWPGGNLLREYTLLLDLQIYGNTETPKAVEPVINEAGAVRRPPESAVATTSPSTSPPTSETAYRVRSGDTLWVVAERVRPDAGVTIHQMMMALQKTNPEGFINGNINLLKNGYLLKIPETGEIKSFSNEQAVDAFRQQSQSWSQTQARPSSQTGSSREVSGKLIVGPINNQTDSRITEDNDAEKAIVEPSPIQRELDLSELERIDFKRRISELESQLEIMQKLVQTTNEKLKIAIELSAQKDTAENNEIAGVNPTISEPDNSSDLTAATPIGTSKNLIDKPIIIAETDIGSGTNTLSQSNDASSVTSLVEIFKQNLLAVGLGLLAFIFLLVALLQFRKKERNNLITISENEDIVLDTESVFLDTEVPQEKEVIQSKDDKEDDKVQTDDIEVRALTDDVIAEADIFFSLGQEDTAIELLKREINQNPNNEDAQLALLKIYVSSKNMVEFEKQYTQLDNLGNPYLKSQATLLFKKLSNSLTSEAESVELDVDELDLDELVTDDENYNFEDQSFEDQLNLEANGGDELSDRKSAKVTPLRESSEQRDLDDKTNYSELNEMDVDIIGEEELDFLEATPYATSKIDMAKAYLDMGDIEKAASLLNEVMAEGDKQQKEEAQELMKTI